ncbi:MAG: hypothetical protein WBF49_05185, partial [Methyloceanibacter sp.]
TFLKVDIRVAHYWLLRGSGLFFTLPSTKKYRFCNDIAAWLGGPFEERNNALRPGTDVKTTRLSGKS